MLVAILALTGCDGNAPITPGDSRFGQIGVVQIQVETPLALGVGELIQGITWTSRGDWTLKEEIFYQGVRGDASDQKLSPPFNVSAGVYAQWIAQVNGSPGLDLFIPGLDPDLEPECPASQSRVTLSIRDQRLDETRDWVRCAPGSLRNLTPSGSGPDANAARVINAAALVRDFTVGSGFTSEYRGSVPFATLAQGEGLGTVLNSPIVLTQAEEFATFWTGAGLGAVPTVDFTEDMVIVAAAGIRNEAGDSVEVRRILPVETGTLVEVVERVPGNFCSPASRQQVPYHVVVLPRVSNPVRFSELRVELVPCG